MSSFEGTLKQNTCPETLWFHAGYRAQKPFAAVIYSCLIQLCPNYITLKLIMCTYFPLWPSSGAGHKIGRELGEFN